MNEPSVVTINTETNKPIAVGEEARDMLGKTPGKFQAIRPLKDGVIADFQITEILLTHFINKLNLKPSPGDGDVMGVMINGRLTSSDSRKKGHTSTVAYLSYFTHFGIREIHPIVLKFGAFRQSAITVTDGEGPP